MNFLNISIALLIGLSGPTTATDTDSPVTLNDKAIAARHDFVQAHSCKSGFAVTGSGQFLAFNEIDNTFSAHVCAATKDTRSVDGAAAMPGSVQRVSGKVFNAATQANGMKMEYYYHAHCMYVDANDGGVYVGVEIQELTERHLQSEDPTNKDKSKIDVRKLSVKSGKKKKGSKSSAPTESPTQLICPSGASASNQVCCFLDCCTNGGSCDTCCCLTTRNRKLTHANKEITSGNEPKGTLGILYFQREEDHTENHARYGISLFNDFDTTCSDFEDAVSRAEISHGKVTQGAFRFEEPL